VVDVIDELQNKSDLRHFSACRWVTLSWVKLNRSTQSLGKEINVS